MGYKKTDYDPNYQLSGEDMRKHRRGALMLVPMFLLVNWVMAERQDASSWSRFVMEGIWVIYVLLIVAILTGFAYKKWGGDEVHILEDESAQFHRANSFKWGWLAAVAMALALFFVAPHAPNLDTRETVVVLLMTMIITTTLRFVILEGDEDDDEE